MPLDGLQNKSPLFVCITIRTVLDRLRVLRIKYDFK